MTSASEVPRRGRGDTTEASWRYHVEYEGKYSFLLENQTDDLCIRKDADMYLNVRGRS